MNLLFLKKDDLQDQFPKQGKLLLIKIFKSK